MAKKYRGRWATEVPNPSQTARPLVTPSPLARARELAAQNRLPEAIEAARHALAIRRNDREATLLLASLYEREGQPEHAVESLAQALALSPGNVEILKEIARILLQTGAFSDAVEVLQTLAAILPHDAAVRRNWGVALAQMRRFGSAGQQLEAAVELEPADVLSWRALSQVREQRGEIHGAVEAIARAAALVPNDWELALHHARMLFDLNRQEEAHSRLARLGRPEARLVDAMLMPVIPTGTEQIARRRSQLHHTLTALREEGVKLEHPDQTVPLTNFHLGYHGLDDRDLMEQTTATLLAGCPDLGYVSPQLERAPLQNRRVKVGFLSSLFRTHSVGRVLNRLMRELNRERFEVVLLEMPGKYEGGQEVARGYADRTVTLAGPLAPTRRQIEAETLDVILFGDIVMEPATFYLSFSRLAPVQCTTWGHPGTSGRPSIDYWISCEDWEPAGNERRYSERLVRLKQPPMIATRVATPEQILTREELGLPQNRLYLCPQSLYKLHPDFDHLAGEVLRRDPEARLVFVSTVHETWRRTFEERFTHANPDLTDRLIWLPKLSMDPYLSLLHHGEVSLDPIYFGGGNTTMDALSQGLPVVTLPGNEMRSRMALSFYRMMGLTDLIVDTPEAYVDLAVRLGTDREMRDRYSREILDRCPAIFDTVEVAREFEAFFERAVAEAIPA